MMTKAYNTTRYLFVVALLLGVLSLGAPSVAFAAQATTTDAASRGVCLRLVAAQTALSDKLAIAARTYAQTQTKRLQTMRTDARDRSAGDTAARLEADKAFASRIKILKEKAGDDKTKQAAVSAFASTVEHALKTRRASADTAQQAFFDGTQALANTRASEIEKIASVYKNAVLLAFSDARSACSTGGDPKEVRDTLRAKLSSLTDAFKGKISDVQNLTGQAKALSDARAKALAEGATQFSEEVDRASQALNLVLQY